MFGFFKDAKIKAQCLGDTYTQVINFTGIDLNHLNSKENYDLQENAFKILQDKIGKQGKYLEIEMVIATWLALLNAIEKDSKHTLQSKKNTLELGFKEFLSLRLNDIVRNGMPKKLFELLDNYT